MPKSCRENKDKTMKPQSQEEDLFSNRGSPAFMSTKEPAIRMLKERYGESFALTLGTEMRVHLFLIKYALWALIWTFVAKEGGEEEKDSPGTKVFFALEKIETALSGRDPDFLAKLDSAVEKGKSRLRNKANEFGLNTA